MVEALIKHNVKWLAPSPLWTQDGINATGAQNGSFSRPAILRFQNDLFMEELLALTAYQPDRLNEWVAQPETWREPMPASPTAAQLRVVDPISKRSQKIAQQTARLNKNRTNASTSVSSNNKNTNGNYEQLPFKLYQPAHQRYYLVSAALVCRVPGLPDRAVDPGKQEQASFVIRRLTHKNQDVSNACDPNNHACQEYSFVNTPDGYAWKALEHSKREHIQAEEERLPLFAINFDETRYRRRLLAGLIPVGKRESYLAAPKHKNTDPNSKASSETQTSPDPRRILFKADVTAPWKALVEQAQTLELGFLDGNNPIPTSSDNNTPKENFDNVLKTTREQIQTASWYILLDFAKFLDKHLNAVCREIKGETPDRTLTEAEAQLATAIKNVTIGAGTPLYNSLKTGAHPSFTVTTSLSKALADIAVFEDDLEEVDYPLNIISNPFASDDRWPNFLFPLANPAIYICVDTGVDTYKIKKDTALSAPLPDPGVDTTGLDEFEKPLAKIDGLADLVEAALDVATKPLPEIEAAQEPWDKRDAWFVIRCVYERPNCGPINPEVVSDPTQPFQMAPFFDPDAPARPIRIPMPIDISPAGLRKFKNNTTFMISDMLCGKIKGIRKLTLGDLVLSVLPWPFHKDLPSVGPTGPCSGKDGNFGMFCSLSIPIVTLCALILLLIIVPLFNVFFRWLPYLFTCLPIPGLKGKKNA